MHRHMLEETDVMECNVVVDIMPKSGYVSSVKISPEYIVIHNTGNLNMNATTNHMHVKYFCTSCMNRGHTHFIVDDEYIYQSQYADIKCFHTGTKIGNESSIGIEICGFTEKCRQKKCYDNTIKLINVLMKYYNIKQVNRHCDWSKSSCPIWLNTGMHGYTWEWFISQINSKGEDSKWK